MTEVCTPPTSHPYIEDNLTVVYTIDSYKQVEFQYQSQQSNDRKVYFATRRDSGDPLCIKFTQGYGEKAHRAVAALGIAPKLRAVEGLPMKWLMVIMEDI